MKTNNEVFNKVFKHDENNFKMQQKVEVAKEFEKMYVDIMLQTMRKTSIVEDTSNATEIYKDMLDSEYSKTMTDGYNFGIRDIILDWMKNTDIDLAKTNNTELDKIHIDNKQNFLQKKALNSYINTIENKK